MMKREAELLEVVSGRKSKRTGAIFGSKKKKSFRKLFLVFIKQPEKYGTVI